MPSISRLQALPEELLQDILERLTTADLTNLNLASTWAYHIATPLIWRDLELIDRETHHPLPDSSATTTITTTTTDPSTWPLETDTHDDLPILQKLYLLATSERLASYVQTLTHRCHLPAPAIFTELPRNPFCGSTLSSDPRTVELVKLAVTNMKKVTTLRIILGHPNLTDALLRCFFDEQRREEKGYVAVRKLWLENCRISVGLNPVLVKGAAGNPHGLPGRLRFEGLQSVRFRRLPLRSGTSMHQTMPPLQAVYARGSIRADLQDGIGGMYTTTMNDVDMEFRAGENYIMNLVSQERSPMLPSKGLSQRISDDEHPLEWLFEISQRHDDRIYETLMSKVDLPEEVLRLGELSKREKAIMAYRGNWLDPDDIENKHADQRWIDMQRERIPSSWAAVQALKNASATLTSLNFDWVLSVPQAWKEKRDTAGMQKWLEMYRSLFELRFPHLRAFQFRNCVVSDAVLPPGLFLLDHTSPFWTDDTGDGKTGDSLACLAFMEAHPNIQCLAWPMDSFFSSTKASSETTMRVEKVIQNLSRTLIDLRIDTKFSGNGESKTEELWSPNYSDRTRRRRFITDFAAHIHSVNSIKIEGGMPRDERRETIRALHLCPLQKVVMIGVCDPLGNTWGHNGKDVLNLIEDHERQNLEAEDKHAIFSLGTKPLPASPMGHFTPTYGWTSAPPLLHTLATTHSQTLTTLKFCGYKGSPILFSPTPITTPLLSSLKHLHNLQSLILSLWLPTNFEGANRDREVIQFWSQARDPASKALVLITDEEPSGWEKELRSKFQPDALAWRVTNFLGPFLSETAKSRGGRGGAGRGGGGSGGGGGGGGRDLAGVHIRASFSLGDFGGIFDLDLWVGKGALGSDVCLGWEGPREEGEKERRREKVEGRGWF